MELVKNIFFNTDKLTQNSKVKISYTGDLFQNGSEEIFIHYGFGLLWDNLGELKMEKTDLGFQVEIELLESETFNFCFKNEKNEWDNNGGSNYIFPLEAVSTDLVRLEDFSKAINTPRRLRKGYLFSKKLRLAIYKIITFVPRLVSGNYKRKTNEND